MSLLPCHFEPDILAAGRDDPAAAAHLAGCARCREALDLQGELLGLARRTVPWRPLPPAGELELRAELARRLSLEPLAAAPRRRRSLAAVAGAALLVAGATLAPAGALAELVALAGAAAPATRVLLVALLAAIPAALAGAAWGLFGEEV